jgi:hypothetical protein
MCSCLKKGVKVKFGGERRIETYHHLHFCHQRCPMLIEREKKYALGPGERHVRGSNKCLLLQQAFELRNKHAGQRF